MPHNDPPLVFSPTLRRRRLERAAVNFREHAFIHERVAEDLVDRLESVQRTFQRALFYGPGAPFVAERLTDKAAVEAVTHACESGALLKRLGIAEPVEAAATALPFPSQSFDLVISSMSLHCENDIPAALLEAKRVLRPDGLFLASFPAERTLAGLREALRDVEAGLTGRVSPRVAPFVAIKDGGALLQRTGFALPVADTHNVRVSYQTPGRLLTDLRGMGETSVLVKSPRGAFRRDVLAALADKIAGQEVLFEILVMTGWTPHPSQQKPLKPGSAKTSLAAAVFEQISDDS